jgi:DNA-binding LacI/PurR family transcriptional regulator
MGLVSESKIYERLRMAFARPPAAAGRRLKSEPALAKLMGLKRTQLRKVLDRFVEDGVLVRRHGSGTFLRKALEIPEFTSEASGSTFDPFSDLENEESRRRASITDCSLKFSVLSDFLSPHLSGTYRKIYEGLSSRSEESGHSVEINNSVRVFKAGESRARVLKALLETACDGIIVRADDLELLEMLDEEGRVPTLFIEVGMSRKEVEPIVSFGRKEAMRRALALLAAEGAKKIGLVGWFTPGHNEEYRKNYLDCIHGLGLDFTACQFLSEDRDKNRALFEMLFGRHSEPPQALYFADDVALRHASGLFRELGVVPGRDVGVIAEADRGVSLPPGIDWSVMMFDPFQVGRLAIDCLEAAIQTAGDELVSLTHEASWRAGATHRLA